MKKIYLISLGLLLVLAVAARVVIAPGYSITKGQTVQTAIPDDVSAIFQKSCYSCHAEGGSKIAMSKVNFTGWDQYSPEKQAKKAAAVCKMIAKDKMPPKKFVKSNPDKVLNAEEKKVVCTWAQSLQPEKKEKK